MDQIRAVGAVHPKGTKNGFHRLGLLRLHQYILLLLNSSCSGKRRGCSLLLSLQKFRCYFAKIRYAIILRTQSQTEESSRIKGEVTALKYVIRQLNLILEQILAVVCSPYSDDAYTWLQKILMSICLGDSSSKKSIPKFIAARRGSQSMTS